MTRIDDANRRILTKKFELGLFERPLTDRRFTPTVGSVEHQGSLKGKTAAIALRATKKTSNVKQNDPPATSVPPWRRRQFRPPRNFCC